MNLWRRDWDSFSPVAITPPPKPATLTDVRSTYSSSTGSVRVGFESHVLFSLSLFSRYTRYEQRNTKLWRTQLQPIRTFGEITANIKILPVLQPYLYQNLSQKATQLRLLGMTYGEIAENLHINRKTATKACEYQGDVIRYSGLTFSCHYKPSDLVLYNFFPFLA